MGMHSRLYPLRLQPILVEKPWGGRSLEAMGKQLPGNGLFGESWEVADLPDTVVRAPQVGRTRVKNGAHVGRALRGLIAEFGEDLLGSIPPTPAGDFPLLVKYLDAREHLSVQVHPNADYVKRNPETRFKTESWYVVAAEPEAVLYLGVREGVTDRMVEGAVGTPELVGLLRRIPATPGAFVHVPAGTVHALGAGVVVAEIQTPSDTTFRLYDWTQEHSRPQRQLHLIEGLAAIDLGQQPEPTQPMPGAGRRTLVSNEFYWVRELRGPDVLVLKSGPEPRVLMVISGAIHVRWEEDQSLLIRAGGSVILPATVVANVVVESLGEATILEIGLG
jgi:mannose-6-phosphate isomerase